MLLFARDQAVITTDDVHQLINIIAVLLLILIVLGVVGRVFTKKFVIGTYKVDDYLILAAFISSIAQTAAILVASSSGLGTHQNTVASSKQIIFEKAIYASGLLYILSITLAKMSIIHFILNLSPARSTKRIGITIDILLALWAISSVLSAAFQCPLPHPWQSENQKCIDLNSFWTSYDVINILTDVVLIIWPGVFVSRLQMSLQRRVIVIACFSCRILVIGATIAKLITVRTAFGTTDPTFDQWPVVICSLVVQSLSITTACVLYLRPFLDSLESGLLRSDDLRRRGFGDSRNGRKTSSAPYNSQTFNAGSQESSTTNRSSPAKIPAIPLNFGGDFTTSTTIKAEPPEQNDADSMTSRSNFINRTTLWSISREAHG